MDDLETRYKRLVAWQQEMNTLRQRIAELEAENERLRKENEAAIFVLQEIAELSPEVGATWAAKFAESHLKHVKCAPSF